jgi:hypothetical protein
MIDISVSWSLKEEPAAEIKSKPPVEAVKIFIKEGKGRATLQN